MNATAIPGAIHRKLRRFNLSNTIGALAIPRFVFDLNHDHRQFL
jgi:hypothetical protein